MGIGHMESTLIIFALVVALENNQYKLLQVYENKQDCKVVERQQKTLARCFKVTINRNDELKNTVDKINEILK